MNCALCKSKIFPKLPVASNTAYLKGLAILCPICIKNLNTPNAVVPEVVDNIYLKVKEEEEFFVSRLGAIRDEKGFYISKFHDKFSNYL